MAKVKNSDNTKCWQGCGETYIAAGIVEVAQPQWITWQFLKTMKPATST